MKKLIFIILLTLLVTANKVNGQDAIDSVLAQISKNNTTIFANTKYWDAKILEFKTGLTPYNPNVEYDYLFGSPANSGNQTEFSITQAFDFPTVYSKRKKLSNEKIKQAEFQLGAGRQDILLAAKLICIELVYRNKLNVELSMRMQNAEKWLLAFRRSLEIGDGNIMDVNKANLQLVEINAIAQENSSIINQLNQKLTELNGGIPIQFLETTYTSNAQIMEFAALEAEIEATDPVRKYLEQEKVIGQHEVTLSKAQTLPKIEAGYHYQAFLGQRFNGVHVGMSIPLWESKNIVKTKQAEVMLKEANLQDHINEHYYDIMQKYERMTNLKITIDEYAVLFNNMNAVELLDKSLQMGQISTIEYFMELSYYYNAVNKLYETEMEYYKVVAELLKYKL